MTLLQKGAPEFRKILSHIYIILICSLKLQSLFRHFLEGSFMSLDRTDRRILHLLQKNGRLTNSELAKSVNVSPATCHRRTQRLFDDGFVRSVRAEVEPAKVDRGALAVVGVVLDRSTPQSFAAFENAIAKLPFVLDCHLVAGDFDYFLKIRVRDISDFNRLHGEQLIALPGVRQTRTFFVMKEVVDNAPLDF
jgi:Lrp/AsnC family transcriptional regulator, leucine-responsive regulatory protein